MSMFASFPFDDRIEILSDGAVYFPDGLMLFDESKVSISPDVPAAITGRGNRHTVEKMTEAAFSYFKDYGFAGGMKALETEFAEWHTAGYDGPPFQLFIAGFWEGLGLRQFTVSSHDDAMFVGTKSFEVNTVTGVGYAGPPFKADDVAAFLNEESIARGAAEFGPEFCQYLRGRTDYVIDDPDRREIHMVGGHIDLTTITAKGASTRRLMTWPDKPFHYIDPTLQPVIEPALSTPEDAGLMAAAA